MNLLLVCAAFVAIVSCCHIPGHFDVAVCQAAKKQTLKRCDTDMCVVRQNGLMLHRKTRFLPDLNEATTTRIGAGRYHTPTGDSIQWAARWCGAKAGCSMATQVRYHRGNMNAIAAKLPSGNIFQLNFDGTHHHNCRRSSSLPRPVFKRRMNLLEPCAKEAVRHVKKRVCVANCRPAQQRRLVKGTKTINRRVCTKYCGKSQQTTRQPYIVTKKVKKCVANCPNGKKKWNPSVKRVPRQVCSQNCPKGKKVYVPNNITKNERRCVKYCKGEKRKVVTKRTIRQRYCRANCSGWATSCVVRMNPGRDGDGGGDGGGGYFFAQEETPHVIDHGEVNGPLSKRSSITGLESEEEEQEEENNEGNEQDFHMRSGGDGGDGGGGMSMRQRFNQRCGSRCPCNWNNWSKVRIRRRVRPSYAFRNKVITSVKYVPYKPVYRNFRKVIKRGKWVTKAPVLKTVYNTVKGGRWVTLPPQFKMVTVKETKYRTVHHKPQWEVRQQQVSDNKYVKVPPKYEDRVTPVTYTPKCAHWKHRVKGYEDYWFICYCDSYLIMTIRQDHGTVQAFRNKVNGKRTMWHRVYACPSKMFARSSCGSCSRGRNGQLKKHVTVRPNENLFRCRKSDDCDCSPKPRCRAENDRLDQLMKQTTSLEQRLSVKKAAPAEPEFFDPPADHARKEDIFNDGNLMPTWLNKRQVKVSPSDPCRKVKQLIEDQYRRIAQLKKADANRMAKQQHQQQQQAAKDDWMDNDPMPKDAPKVDLESLFVKEPEPQPKAQPTRKAFVDPQTENLWGDLPKDDELWGDKLETGNAKADDDWFAKDMAVHGGGDDWDYFSKK